MVIQLAHPTGICFLRVQRLPQRVTPEDLRSCRYGEILRSAPEEVTAVYVQQRGPRSAWVKQRFFFRS
jgi:hypothetical protein